MKRLILVGLFLLAMVGVFGAVAASEEGKLLIWADELRSSVLKDIAQKFTEKYKVVVQVQELGFGD
ncbi:MAG: hypothetical protein GX493_08030, partial [Firmicutes bacterium]|nr:hypothetical protein [Bacillota bacterium]